MALAGYRGSKAWAMRRSRCRRRVAAGSTCRACACRPRVRSAWCVRGRGSGPSSRCSSIPRQKSTAPRSPRATAKPPPRACIRSATTCITCARTVAATSDLAAIRQALKLYRLANQRSPTTEQGLAALVTKPVDPPLPPNWKPGGYLEKLPRDPWGHSYQYLNPGLKSDVDVFTYGADGQPGGTGADADLGSWDL